MHNKVVFTTGEISDLIHVHQTTVIDWIEKGMLSSYKTPGGHRRISREDLLTFLAKHKMPVPNALIKPESAVALEKHRHIHEDFNENPYKIVKMNNKPKTSHKRS